MVPLGLAPWMFMPAITGAREAWDTPVYFVGVLPALALAAAIGAWISPSRAWLLAPAAVVGQVIGLLSTHPPTQSPLWILGVIMLCITHAPVLGVALGSAAIRRKLDR